MHAFELLRAFRVNNSGRIRSCRGPVFPTCRPSFIRLSQTTERLRCGHTRAPCDFSAIYKHLGLHWFTYLKSLAGTEAFKQLVRTIRNPSNKKTTAYGEREELGKVRLVEFYSVCPRRIRRTFELQLQIVEGAVCLSIREFGQCLQSKQSILYSIKSSNIKHICGQLVNLWSCGRQKRQTRQKQ